MHELGVTAAGATGVIPVDVDLHDASAYLAGDINAGERLFGRHAAPLRRLLLQMSGDPDLACDLGQDVVERLLRQDSAALRRWVADPRGSFGAYLRRIALRIWIDHCRSAWQRRRRGLETVAEPTDPHAARRQRRMEARRVIEELAGGDLGIRDRRVLRMLLGDLPRRQIAALLQCSENNACVLVHRLLGRLRRQSGTRTLPRVSSGRLRVSGDGGEMR